MEPKFNRSKVKIDGLWFWRVVRSTGTLLEYSFNRCKSFHLDQQTAYQSAYEQGNLDLCSR